MNKNDLIGNLTTIIKAFSMIIAGWVIGLFASQGLDLGLTQTDIATAITTILFIILAYYDAKYPNTLLPKADTNQTIITTDELSEAIKEASKEVETTEEDEITDEVVDEDDQQ